MDTDTVNTRLSAALEPNKKGNKRNMEDKNCLKSSIIFYTQFLPVRGR